MKRKRDEVDDDDDDHPIMRKRHASEQSLSENMVPCIVGTGGQNLQVCIL